MSCVYAVYGTLQQDMRNGAYMKVGNVHNAVAIESLRQVAKLNLHMFDLQSAHTKERTIEHRHDNDDRQGDAHQRAIVAMQTEATLNAETYQGAEHEHKLRRCEQTEQQEEEIQPQLV